MEENYVQFTMRMEKDLYEQLKESAKRNKRSIAKELEYLTDVHLNTEPLEVTLPDDIAKRFLQMLEERRAKREFEI